MRRLHQRGIGGHDASRPAPAPHRLPAGRCARLAALLCGLVGCPASEPMDASDTTVATDASSSGDSPTDATDGPSSESSGVLDPTADTTAGTSAPPMTDSGPPPPPPEPRLCSLDEFDPEADPAMLIDYGDGEGQIPTVIGEALARNCGCHYTDMLPPGTVDYMSDKQKLNTLEDFHTNFAGVFPQGYGDMPAYLAVEKRVVEHDPLPMPPPTCDVEGEDGIITMADLALFTEWLAAGAPDGATFGS